jgi:DNA-binding transcriptional ArsR family regulator
MNSTMAFGLTTLTRSDVLKKRTSCQGLRSEKASAPFALSHQTFRCSREVRRVVFKGSILLIHGPRPVNEIGERLQLNQPRVSKHLRVLKAAGLVDVQPRAQQRLYELRARCLRQLHDWLERYRQLCDAPFEELNELVEEIKAKEMPDGRRKRR